MATAGLIKATQGGPTLVHKSSQQESYFLVEARHLEGHFNVQVELMNKVADGWQYLPVGLWRQ